MKHLAAALLLALCALVAAGDAVSAPEKSRVTIAVGGKAALYYLPLTVAERRGYFKSEGLAVEILDFPGGAKALQAMMGGSADVVAGGFDHVIVLRARGQKLKAFVQQVATPSLVLAVSKRVPYRSASDLKGKKIGVTAPGSSTHMLVSYLLAQAGLDPDDVSVIGVGTGATAVAAMRNGQLDALANVEPAITILERAGVVNVVAETMSPSGSRAVFGDVLPAGCLYTKEEFIRANPGTVQALTNAIVRALRWIDKARPEEIADVVPPEYIAGDRTSWLAALQRSREGYSKDGIIAPRGAQALYEVLRRFDPAVKDGPALDVTRTYDNSFVQRVPTSR